MSKFLFNLITASLTGLITALLIILCQDGANVSVATALGILATVFAFALLTPSIFNRVKHYCCELDWAEEIAKTYQNIPAVYRKSFWSLFGLINLAYLFHTINFMWGGSDWAAVRSNVDVNESLQDGRYAAFLLQEVLFNGKILPVANNLWTFFGLSLAGVLLAHYWNLPKQTSTIVITGLILAVNPYTLSWLYSAKNTLGCLWLPALSLCAILLAETKQESPNKTLLFNLLSVILFVIVLGTYLPAINFILVAIVGKIFIKAVYADVKLKDAFLYTQQSLVNLFAGLMFYIFIILILEEIGILEYTINLSAALANLCANIPELLKSMISQFVTPLPFTDLGYQLLFLLLVIATVFTIIFKSPNMGAAQRGLILLPLLLIASKLSILLTADLTQNSHYLAQNNFYSLPLIYALMFVMLVRLGGKRTVIGAYTLCIILIFMSFVRVAYAQKVWKFGWDAETKLAERIITRLEKMPEFNINRQYKLLQIGEMSLRQKYYLKRPYEQANGNLLTKSYYPADLSKDAYNFFYQTDFLNENATLEALKEPAIQEYLLNKARAWPAKESLWIYNDYIIMVIDDQALNNIQKSLSH